MELGFVLNAIITLQLTLKEIVKSPVLMDNINHKIPVRIVMLIVRLAEMKLGHVTIVLMDLI